MTSFTAWFNKWFVHYWRWTLPLVIMFVLLIVWIGYLLVMSGGGSFLFFLVIATIGIAGYRATRGEYPPAWIMVLAISIPLFLWGFWAIQPEWYAAWRGSKYFLWMLLTGIALAWLSGHPNAPAAKAARTALIILLLIVVGIGAYGAWNDGSVRVAAATTSSRPAPPNVITHYPDDIIVTREWSDWMGVPDNHRLCNTRAAVVAYESMDEHGNIRQYPRVLTKLPARTVNPKKLRFRIMEDEPIDTLHVKLTYEHL